jgi:hypothetical protein
MEEFERGVSTILALWGLLIFLGYNASGAASAAGAKSEAHSGHNLTAKSGLYPIGIIENRVY